MTNVGINGFCRIGRVVLRTCLENSNIKVTAINDPAIDIEYMCYLIKFDSTHGKFMDGEVVMRRNHDEIQINDTIIKIFHEKSPTKIPWQLADVHYVVEASGMFTTMEKASGHISNNGVEQVIVTAPSINIPMLVLGVNEDNINSDIKVISSTSSTLYCLAPIIKVLEDNFGVSEGFITSIHAMTPSLKPLDGMCLRGKYWRDHRSIHQNIIPASTGACKALGKILPSVKDKLTGTAFRVPIVNVSVLDLTVRLNTPTSITDIMLAVEKMSGTKMKNIIRITNEEAVSSDFMNDSFSCIVDVGSSIQLRPNFFKLICWYENEYSYACRVIDTILFTAKLNNPTIELKNRVSATTLRNQAGDGKENRSPTRRTSALLKRESSATFQECAHKAITRIPQRKVGKHNSDSTINTKKSLIVSNQQNHGTYDVDGRNSIKPSVNINKVNNYDVSKKTVAKTISTVKIFQAQQERLEKVKKEFDKVASFTEELLNKTKVFNDTLMSLDNESINGPQKNDVQKFPEVAQSNLTYVKSAEPGKEKGNMLTISSDFSEEVKNWNLADFKDSILNQSMNENESTAENQTDSLEFPSNHGIFQKIPLTIKQCLVSEIGIREHNEESNDKTKEQDFKADNMENTTSVESCYKNIADVSSGQVYDTMSHEVSYDRYLNETKTFDKCNEQFDDGLRNIPSVSKMNSNEAETLNSKIEISKDLSDLYDKLDSVSNTGSESSFKDKKSQIIKFSDLSHSMEELDKLDQFCRIIEISDEISDHLFAALKNTASVPKGEWSFGDLCKRLNLEEFCKKMFQKPNV